MSRAISTRRPSCRCSIRRRSWLRMRHTLAATPGSCHRRRAPPLPAPQRRPRPRPSPRPPRRSLQRLEADLQAMSAKLQETQELLASKVERVAQLEHARDEAQAAHAAAEARVSRPERASWRSAKPRPPSRRRSWMNPTRALLAAAQRAVGDRGGAGAGTRAGECIERACGTAATAARGARERQPHATPARARAAAGAGGTGACSQRAPRAGSAARARTRHELLRVAADPRETPPHRRGAGDGSAAGGGGARRRAGASAA